MELSSPDVRLIRECLAGSEAAWTALIDKYKNLIYSVPVRWGFSPSDASDIFQSVVAELLAELPRLREPKALPAWLIQVSSHKCSEWRKQQTREIPQEDTAAVETTAAPGPSIEALLEQAGSAQMLREAIFKIPPRCRELIRLLFFENPVHSYPEIAASLGLATGSIGFIRARCLKRLRKYLEEAGFR